MKHKTFFGKIFGSAWDSIKGFFNKLFKEADHDLLQTAIIITEGLKAALQTGVIRTFVQLTPTKVDDNLLQIANDNLPKLLASEQLLQVLKTGATEADAEVILTTIVDNFGGLSDKGKEELYTSIAAKFYVLVMEIKNGKKITFGKAALLIESAWEEYQQWKNSKNEATKL